jgi:uncharacterized protein (UPF0335 family)
VVDKEMLEAVRTVMKEELAPILTRQDRLEQGQAKLEQGQASIQDDISVIKEDIEILKEDSAINRLAANILLEWADVFDRTTLNEIIKNHAQA